MSLNPAKIHACAVPACRHRSDGSTEYPVFAEETSEYEKLVGVPLVLVCVGVTKGENYA